jgi:pilus assembly protein Flp/PilA
MLVSYFAAIGNFARRLRKDVAGVTAIEYGLIAGAIAVAIIGTVLTLGTDIKNEFTAVSGALQQAQGTSTTSTN